MIRFLAVVVCLGAVNARAQTPQNPNPQLPAPKQPPVAQAPPQQTQLYQLVPVQSPPTTQVVQQQPVQYQTVQVAQPQYQAISTYAAPTSVQTVGLSTQSSGQRTLVMGPGPVALSMSWLGQRMANMGKTHVWTINHSTVRTNMVQQAPIGQTYQVQLVQQAPPPPTQVQLVQQAPPTQVYQVVQQAPPSEQAPPPPLVGMPPPVKATPQAQSTVTPHKLFGLIH